MSNKWIFPSSSVRKAIAWLPLKDAFEAAVVDRRWRACATCTIVAHISSKALKERITACKMVKSLCTDLATLHAAVVADVTIALIKFLQDAQELNDDGSVAVATDTIMHIHNRYMAILNDNGDPYHESAESEILAELPILAGLKAKRPAEDSEEEEDDSEDGTENIETEASKVDSNFSELNLGKAGTEEYNIGIRRNLTPPLKVICHYPPVFVPCSSLPKISGSEAITLYSEMTTNEN